MRRHSLVAPLLVGAALALASPPAAAHGGVYRGPGSTVGPGGATGGGPSTGGAGAKDTDSASWSQWWSLNRDAYLALKDRIHGVGTETGSDDFFLGQGQGPRDPGLRPAPETIRDDVVPALLRALEDQPDVDILTGSLMALGKIGGAGSGLGDSELAPVLRGFLAHRNQEVHETAAIALGVLAEPDVATTLVDVMMDTPAGRDLCARAKVPRRTRAFAAYGLGLVGYRARSDAVKGFAAHHLALVVDGEADSDTDLRVAGVVSLGLVRLENGAIPDPESKERLRPGTSRQAAIAFLLATLSNRKLDARVRAYAPVALARLELGAEPSSKEEITRHLLAAIEPRSREDKVVQQGVVHGLGLLGDGDEDPVDVAIRRALEAHVEHGDRLARNLALVSLARVTGREGAGEAGASAAEGREFLLRRLSKGGTATRPWAGLALGLLERAITKRGGDPSEAVRLALRHALEGTANPSEFGAYAIALGLAGDLASARELVERAETGDEGARGYAAIALGLMRAGRAIGPLQNIVRSVRYKPALLREAAIALALIGDKQAASDLVVRLATSKRLLEQVSVASAIGYIGDARSIEPLIGVLENERLSETTRAFAAVALGVVCDKERYPWNSKIAADAGWWESPATLLDPIGGKGLLDIF